MYGTAHLHNGVTNANDKPSTGITSLFVYARLEMTYVTMISVFSVQIKSFRDELAKEVCVTLCTPHTPALFLGEEKLFVLSLVIEHLQLLVHDQCCYFEG